jgi:hypothetical protein
MFKHIITKMAELTASIIIISLGIGIPVYYVSNNENSNQNIFTTK